MMRKKGQYMLLNKWYSIILLLLSGSRLASMTVTPVTGQPFSSGGAATDIAYSPLVNGKLFSAIVNADTNTLISYVVDTSNGSSAGAFTPAGPIAATGMTPLAVAFSPFVNNNLFAATTNQNSSDISIFSVDTVTGILTAVPSSPLVTGGTPTDIVFSQVINGKLYAFMVEASGKVHSYDVNTTTGQFTEILPNQSTAFVASSIAISPLVQGNVFVAVTAASQIFVFSLNLATGQLTQVQVIPSPFAISVAFSPISNGNLFAITTDNGQVTTSYLVNQATGFFTPVSVITDAVRMPTGGSFSPILNNMLFAAVANPNTNTVTLYSVDMNTGALSELTAAGSPFATDAQPLASSFSPVVGNTVFFATANLTAQNSSVYKIMVPALVLQAGTIHCQTGLVTVTGSGASANGVLQVISDGVTLLGTGTADGAGNFMFTTQIPLLTGTHIITVREAAGNLQSNGITVNCSNLLYSALTQAIKNKYC
jgi:6-phosphogluconolactonase (cycloisomerase 2 family)